MSNPEVTNLLVNGTNGDRSALDCLMPLLYQDLRQLAASRIKRERLDHTLQATALVNELYLRLIDQHRVDWRSRAQFFGLCAHQMRRILIDHARKHASEKGGGGLVKVSINDVLPYAPERADVLVHLDNALEQLALSHARSATVIEMRFFGGMTNQEIAEVLGISANTVINDWNFARAWLQDRLGAEDDGTLASAR